MASIWSHKIFTRQAPPTVLFKGSLNSKIKVPSSFKFTDFNSNPSKGNSVVIPWDNYSSVRLSFPFNKSSIVSLIIFSERGICLSIGSKPSFEHFIFPNSSLSFSGLY